MATKRSQSHSRSHVLVLGSTTVLIAMCQVVYFCSQNFHACGEVSLLSQVITLLLVVILLLLLVGGAVGLLLKKNVEEVEEAGKF